jgi:uncharacterized protein (TIGR03437 family)
MNLPALKPFFQCIAAACGAVLLLWLVSAAPARALVAGDGEMAPLVTVNAASYLPRLAPGAIAVAFGTRLAESSLVAESLPLPVSLHGIGVRVLDSQNYLFSAPIFFISPGQINFLIPEQAALGEARIFIFNEDESIAQGNLLITNSAPALFTFTANGKGAPTALTTSDGEHFAAVANADGSLRAFRPSRPSKLNYLLLFGTGFRYAHRLRIKLGEMEVKPVYAGAQGVLAGLDQINLVLPTALPAGLVNLQVISDGYASNVVQVQVAAN